MKYLNKIVFINSATVKYAEIELDGNVHLIGTQGVGKSTLLRAILFFYNANKTKLGIPRGKSPFDDYYFQYQNSYIVYEISKNDVKFCVLAYKSNGKTAFRFFDSAFKKELFIDDSNRAFESWDHIRNAFGKSIHYSTKISSYTEFRQIIYGDNKQMKPNFRKYALLESKQYENIPRTIQNVFLNSNLEAKFIKETIINSLNEEEFAIDLENYAKNHLRDFESQINDLKIWSKTNKKGHVKVRKQAERVIENYRKLNYANQEQRDLTQSLARRIAFVDSEKPQLTSKYNRENEALNRLIEAKDRLEKTHRNREQKLISKIDLIKDKLKEAKEKQADYQAKGIDEIIQRVAEKESLTTEKKTLEGEKSLLTSKFAGIDKKFDALISQAQNNQQEFKNTQNAKINSFTTTFSNQKEELYETYGQVIKQIEKDNKAEIKTAEDQLEEIKNEENSVGNKKAELKHQSFFKEEIEGCLELKRKLQESIFTAENTIEITKKDNVRLRKEWELETKNVEREISQKVERKREIQQNHRKEIDRIQHKIEQSQTSFYGWLNNNVPDWENNIGKVIDEENVLFENELNPELADGQNRSLFGVKLNLNALGSRVKSIPDYKNDLEHLNQRIQEGEKNLTVIEDEKEGQLHKLKRKFKKPISKNKDHIAENEYSLTQNQEKQKKNKIELDEWRKKSISEKDNQTKKLEAELGKITSKKLEARENLDRIKKGISRKISLKETERNKDIKGLKNEKEKQTASVEAAIDENEQQTQKRINKLKQQKTTELDDRGADTKRINTIESSLDRIEKSLVYIEENEGLVIEFNKDKRELFDKRPELKSKRKSLEKKQDSIAEVHQNEMDKANKKRQKQSNLVQSIKADIDVFEADEEKFQQFKKSDAFASIQDYFSALEGEEENKDTAQKIIEELNATYYRSIEIFENLRKTINIFNGNFGEQNIFNFKVNLHSNDDFLSFASELKEFIEEDKIEEYEKRVNDRFAHIIRQIGNETGELVSKEAEIEKVIRKINKDFLSKNFVQAIKEMEMRVQKSSNPIVRLLIQIKEFNDENSLELGQANLFTSSASSSKNQRAVTLLKQLIKELERYKNNKLSLSESFDLEFRIVENDNDSGWVEKLAHVGSEGTDVLIKAMINILLLNVFKENASKKTNPFKVHCMMDEIGRLHPNNVKGILRFANERNILLINGSPTSQNATDYKYTYKLAKQQSKKEPKKYATKVNRLVKVNPKVAAR